MDDEQRPVKLTTIDGYFELTFASPITVAAAALIYHNFDEGVEITLSPEVEEKK